MSAYFGVVNGVPVTDQTFVGLESACPIGRKEVRCPDDWKTDMRMVVHSTQVMQVDEVGRKKNTCLLHGHSVCTYMSEEGRGCSARSASDTDNRRIRLKLKFGTWRDQARWVK